MGGLFGVTLKENCTEDLFYGTDYHSHLGTHRGGMATLKGAEFARSIHSIENAQFRSKFEDDLGKLTGNMGIGCISNVEDQPLIISSHLGNFSIVTSGRVNNLEDLVAGAFEKRTTHFSEMSGGHINPTELIATLISQESTFEAGLERVGEVVEGSCSVLILTAEGIYAARDKYGRTPLVVGEKSEGICAAVESCALPNLGYRLKYELGPGEVVFFNPDGMRSVVPAGDRLRICAFLWIYYGYPASTYEGRNVELVRNRCGAALARREKMDVDMVAGIPDSGISHAVGYANESNLPYRRPFVKYTPTWPRSFMPRDQEVRNLVARMKLIPIRELIQGKRLLFCDDSIVRGTQLRETIQRLYNHGAIEVHMRPACPPLIYSCIYLNLSLSKSELALAGRRAIFELEGENHSPLSAYADDTDEKYHAMVERIRNRLNLTTLRYQALNDMIEAIGLPKEKVCTYCWDGAG